MRRHSIALTGAVLGAILLGGSMIAAAKTADATVNIDNFTFTPPELTVAPGTKVTWTNRDDIPHTVTEAAEKRSFKSNALDTGETFSHVFATKGTYHYFCSLHPHMQGTVVVE
jgi:plastocyanin